MPYPFDSYKLAYLEEHRNYMLKRPAVHGPVQIRAAACPPGAILRPRVRQGSPTLPGKAGTTRQKIPCFGYFLPEAFTLPLTWVIKQLFTLGLDVLKREFFIYFSALFFYLFASRLPLAPVSRRTGCRVDKNSIPGRSALFGSERRDGAC